MQGKAYSSFLTILAIFDKFALYKMIPKNLCIRLQPTTPGWNIREVSSLTPHFSVVRLGSTFLDKFDLASLTAFMMLSFNGIAHNQRQCLCFNFFYKFLVQYIIEKLYLSYVKTRCVHLWPLLVIVPIISDVEICMCKNDQNSLCLAYMEVSE